MLDQNSYGFSVLTYDEVVGQEPISVESVKEYIGLNFSEHDSHINGLITLTRIAAEEFLSVTLIESRKVDVSWLELRGDEVLPYQVIDGQILVTSPNGSDTYQDADIVRNGNFARIIGDYPNGVKISYSSIRVPDNYIQAISPALVRTVAALFENNELAPKKELKKQLAGFKFTGSFPYAS